jgi:hypothetical protein
MIDHINRDPSDNRIENLRLADASTNQRNRKDQKPGGFRGKVPHVGVYQSYRDGKYLAQICVDGRRYHLGTYEHVQDAINARNLGEKKYWGR